MIAWHRDCLGGDSVVALPPRFRRLISGQVWDRV